MNNIISKQNQNDQIDKLAAQRFLYSKAKKIFVARLSISVVFVILGPFLIFHFDTIKIYIAISAIFYIFFDFIFLRRIENEYRKDGAKIQELFDVELFSLPWNNIVAEEKPDNEKIFLYSKKYKSKNSLENLKDWYPRDINRLNLLPAVAVCQRTNIWWDVSLREKLSWSVIFFMLVLTFIAFIILNKNSENLFLFILFLLPFYETLSDYVKSQFSSIGRIKKLKQLLDNSLCNMTNEINDDDLKFDLRNVQDEIFRHRKSCLFVPDLFYKLFRNSYEEQMNYSAKYYVDEILNRS